MTKQTAASTQVAILKEQNPNKNSPKTGQKRKATAPSKKCPQSGIKQITAPTEVPAKKGRRPIRYIYHMLHLCYHFSNLKTKIVL